MVGCGRRVRRKPPGMPDRKAVIGGQDGWRLLPVSTTMVSCRTLPMFKFLPSSYVQGERIGSSCMIPSRLPFSISRLLYFFPIFQAILIFPTKYERTRRDTQQAHRLMFKLCKARGSGKRRPVPQAMIKLLFFHLAVPLLMLLLEQWG